jgi:hypothetical protein
MRHTPLAGVRVMSMRVRHGTGHNTDGKRHDERDPGFRHHHAFLLKSPNSKDFTATQPPENPVADYSNSMTLRCDHKPLCDKLQGQRAIAIMLHA